MIRLLVCGSRTLEDRSIKIEKYLLELIKNQPVECLISGMARGADIIAYHVFHGQGIKILEFPADWKTHGKKAGPIRNQQMLDEGNPTHVLAFQDTRVNEKGSNGTNHMIRISEKAGKKVHIVRIDK